MVNKNMGLFKKKNGKKEEASKLSNLTFHDETSKYSKKHIDFEIDDYASRIGWTAIPDEDSEVTKSGLYLFKREELKIYCFL